MSKHYQELDQGHFDYKLHHIEGISSELFRGPAIDYARPYIACIGAAQTFGRFCDTPYANLLAEELGVQVLNLGVGGAGPRAFVSPHYLKLLNGAEAVVVQVLSGRSESNSLFDNSGRGKIRGVRLSDNSVMRYEQFLAELIATGSTDLVRQAVAETRENYVSNMISLLDQIKTPKILLWLSSRSPEYEAGFVSAPQTLGAFPHLVDDSMLNKIRKHADLFVECVSTKGLPQRLWSADAQIEGTQLREGSLFNFYYPSPEIHAKVAAMLANACRGIARTEAGSAMRLPPAPIPDRAVRFIVVCAERTGSTLLIDLLNSHPHCTAAGELFNAKLVKNNIVAGMPLSDRKMLIELRENDPRKFIDHVFASSEALGNQASGFKFMYHHGAFCDAALDYLISDRDIRVIHIKRKNLLRRFVSHQQAKATGVWGQLAGVKKVVNPKLDLQFSDLIENLQKLERQQMEFEEQFKDHQILEVFYEDLSVDPHSTGALVANFLGLESDFPMEIRSQKTGSDSMQDAIANYDELRSRMQRWASFFDH